MSVVKIGTRKVITVKPYDMLEIVKAFIDKVVRI